MENLETRFDIGYQFKSRGKYPKTCTVTDILKTYNSKNELVKVRYVATHQFINQIITDYDVPETTLLMSRKII